MYALITLSLTTAKPVSKTVYNPKHFEHERRPLEVELPLW